MKMKEYDGKADKEILDGIQRLIDYACKADEKREIIVLAPSLGSPKKMRVYAYGGQIGAIPINPYKEASLMNKNYLDYLPKDSKKWETLKEILDSSKTQVFQTLLSDKYLDLAMEACKSRFTNKRGDFEERVIETRLMKKYLGNTDYWIPFDIEFSFPHDWMDEGNERGTSDIILYNKKDNIFYLIELKYNNKHCTRKSGLLDHYNKVMKIIKESRDKLVDEFYIKLECLCKYQIINSEAWKEALGSPNKEKVTLKFGYFFIGGNVEKYKRYVEKELGGTDKNCSFLYSPDIDSDILKNCQMLSYDEFMKYKEEV